MYIHRMLCPIKTLGPGNRLVIWTRGCSKKCDECISPEMAVLEGAEDVPVDRIIYIAKKMYDADGYDGITISGGDPFEQLDELLQLLAGLKNITDDILVYTGFVWNDFKKILSPETVNDIQNLITVLIDGPYIKELNTSQLALRGSSNQNIIFFKQEACTRYNAYINEGRCIQSIVMGNDIVSVGIMNR